ncbi:MAG TPA: hypothetical protein EYP08_02340 [Pyrodictiaceae archaeon]|nr:hypothetical protein [Pyrodictiaceae archaeon]
MMMDDQQNVSKECRSTSMLSLRKVVKSIAWPLFLILVGWIGILAVFYTLGQAVKAVEVEGNLIISALRVLFGLLTLVFPFNANGGTGRELLLLARKFRLALIWV